ncbi:WhiB family transcriptional regulator [Pseudonocardia sp. MCCB 268]|nr:WhiB family transcriptional regulator [Pseudonocardia cytotoxica]
MDRGDEARCLSADPELLFPEPGRGQQTCRQVARAVAICAIRVRWTPCLEWAIRHREQFGVRGGVTARGASGDGARTRPTTGRGQARDHLRTCRSKERRAVGVALLARGVRRAEVADRRSHGADGRPRIAAGKRRGRARHCARGRGGAMSALTRLRPAIVIRTAGRIRRRAPCGLTHITPGTVRSRPVAPRRGGCVACGLFLSPAQDPDQGPGVPR